MDTLSETIAVLDARGWTFQFEVEEGLIQCVHCGFAARPSEYTVDHTYRFEGPSDPGDESILFALTSPCGHRGTLATAFGPDVPPETAEAIRQLG